jgi:hypothetical protein
MRFKEFGRLVELRVNKALVEGAAILLNAVREHETRVGDGTKGVHVPEGTHLRDSFESVVVNVLPGAMGVANSRIVVFSRNPNAIWQELGTRSRRRKAYKASSKTANNVFPFRTATSGNSGVAPLYFMRKALKQSAPAIEALIVKAIASAGEFGGGSTLVDTTSLHNPARSTHYPVSPRPFP